MAFGRNRESRTHEAAGRRNWPEAVPGKCAAEKGGDTEVSEIASAGAGGRQKLPQGEKTAGLAHTVGSKRALDSGLYSRV